MKFRDDLKWIVPIVLVCFVVFANSLGGEFVYDDTRQVVRNTLIQDGSLFWKALASDVWAFKGDGTQAASNYWRPTFTLWNIICFRLFGLAPFGWHVGNVVLHAGVSVMAFALLRRWQFTPVTAFVIAIIFAVHPVHVESVAWIAGSPDLLFSLAFLGSLWFATAYRDRGSLGDLVLAIVLYAIALGAKEIGIVCFPIYFLLFLDKSGEKKPKGERNTLLLGIFLTAVSYFLLRWGILGVVSHPAESPPTLGEAILSLPMMFAFYLRQALFPYWLSVHYELPPVTDISLLYFLFPLVVAIAATAWMIYLARSQKAWLGAALFLLPLAPAMNATAFNYQHLVHDRYMYLPILGLLILIVPFIAKSVPERPLLFAGIAVAAVLSVQTVLYNRAWASDLALWTHNYRSGDRSPFGLAQYGTSLSDSGRPQAAVEAFSESIAIDQRPQTYLGRGQAYLSLKKYREAEADFSSALTRPGDLDLYAEYLTVEGLAIAYTEQRKYAEAAKALADARGRLPIYSAALTEKLAVVLYQAGQKAEALRELEAVVPQARRELLPESRAVFFRLGLLYAERGRKDEARNSLNEFLRLSAALNDTVSRQNREHAARVLQTLR